MNGSDPSFSYYFSSETGSFLEFGAPQASQIASGSTSDIVWIPALYNSLDVWANEISGIKIDGGDYFNSIDFATTSMWAQIFTGGQCIYGPRKYILWLREVLADALVSYTYEDTYAF